MRLVNLESEGFIIGLDYQKHYDHNLAIFLISLLML